MDIGMAAVLGDMVDETDQLKRELCLDGTGNDLEREDAAANSVETDKAEQETVESNEEIKEEMSLNGESDMEEEDEEEESAASNAEAMRAESFFPELAKIVQQQKGQGMYDGDSDDEDMDEDEDVDFSPADKNAFKQHYNKVIKDGILGGSNGETLKAMSEARPSGSADKTPAGVPKDKPPNRPPDSVVRVMKFPFKIKNIMSKNGKLIVVKEGSKGKNSESSNKPKNIKLPSNMVSLLKNVNKSLMHPSSQALLEKDMKEIRKYLKPSTDIAIDEKIEKDLKLPPSTVSGPKPRIDLSTVKKLGNCKKPWTDIVNPGKDAVLGKYYRVNRGFRALEKPYECLVCGEGFKESRVVQEHVRIHVSDKPFKCDECGKCYSDHDTLGRHKRVHTGEKPFVCKHCGIRFTWPQTLKKHCHTEHGESLKFQCPDCGKAFTDSNRLEEHVRIHTGERPYLCNICGKTFTTDKGLNRHIKIHTGEKAYSCEVCGKLFTQSNARNVHMKTHRPKTPQIHPCPVCEKQFSQKCFLSSHLRSHRNKGELPEAEECS